MATIGGNDLITKEIDTVIWCWTDDEGKMHIIYFIELIANIISPTALDESMNYDEGTWVLPKIKYYIFIWDFGR